MSPYSKAYIPYGLLSFICSCCYSNSPDYEVTKRVVESFKKIIILDSYEGNNKPQSAINTSITEENLQPLLTEPQTMNFS